MTINDGVTVTLANGDEAKGRFSSLIDNGYYSYTAKNERSGYVNGTNQAEPSLTINGGNFSGGKITIKNDDGATLVINDGTFTNAWNRVVYNANVATINGGSFSCPTNNEIAVDSDGLNETVNKGILTISGGTFEGKVIKSSGSIAVSGGTYTKGIDASYLVEGKTINSNGTVVDKTITIIVPGDTTPAVISALIADEAAIGMVNSKTTAVRVIPAIGRKAGEVLDFGGLLGYGPIMPVNSHDPSVFINRGGRLPAPMQSLKN